MTEEQQNELHIARDLLLDHGFEFASREIEKILAQHDVKNAFATLQENRDLKRSDISVWQTMQNYGLLSPNEARTILKDTTS